MSRPRPRIEGNSNPALIDSEDDARREAAEELLGDSRSMVPRALTGGAKEAAIRRAAAKRAKVAKLDIMAKRRTDDRE